MTSSIWGIARDPADRPTPQIDLPGPEVPSFPLESTPGDVFFLNMNLWHASFGGQPGRRHLALNFTPEPTLPEHIALLKKDYQGVLNLMEQGAARASATGVLGRFPPE